MPETTHPVTRSQRFAQRAFEKVQAYVSRSKEQREKYSGFAKRFPSLIHSCGLAQALAFAQAKGDPKKPNEHDFLLDDLAVVLETRKEEMLENARERPVTEYMRLSREALAAAGWLKRYAEALLDGEKDKQKGVER